MNNQDDARFLGITVLGDFILSEGVEAVLDNVQKAGATAVACNPTVTAAAEEGQGSFQPPIDAGSSPRVFDRPLFGKTSLWVRSGVSYRPRAEFYADCPYGPRRTNDLTEAHGAIIGRFIDRATARGLKVYLQLGAAQPTGLRDEDRPRLPDGRIPPNRMADTASLASEAVRAYNRAYVRDLLETYPKIAGFRPDWPESPCYTLGEAFQDFSQHVARWAGTRGYDFDALQANIARAWDKLHGALTTGDVEPIARAADRDSAITAVLDRVPGAADWLRLKAALSTDMLRAWREAIDEAGGGGYELSANAFMPPYTQVTGLDFTPAAEHCRSIAPKLYTMHWSLMVTFWGEELLGANAELEETPLVRALVRLMDLADPGEGGRRIADYGYPAPDEPHPIPDAPQIRKIAEVRQAVDGRAAVYPLVHGYGPADDFRRRLKLVADSAADGVWINRYGYLSDEKLTAIGEVCR